MANQHDIQHSIIELQARRSKLGTKKQHLQAEIGKVREMLKFIQQGHETFNELVTKKNIIIAETHEIDTELADLKNQIKRRQVLKDEVSEMEKPNQKAIILEAELTVLRDNYLTFAGDKTRIASMRAMSADFAGHLTKLITRLK